MKIIAMSILVILATAASAQVQNPYPRTITVSGSAETEVVPDEIFVQVHLKEYEKKGQGKVTIDKIRQDFLKATRSLALSDTAISVSGYDANNWNPWWRKKNKKEELYASITYQVVLKNTAQVDQLVDMLDDNATQNFYISRTSNSRITELRRQLKIQAVKAAKEKAQYLAEAIGESVGVAVTINEPHEYTIPFFGNEVANVRMKEMAPGETTTDMPQADYRKMKLKFDVTVVFALK